MSVPSLKTSLLASILLSSLHVTAQQTFSFLPSAASASFPACGLSCQLLLEAQSACVPPQAGVSNVDTYVSCFCQSSLITGLTYTASMCPGCTAPTDQQLLSTWYKNYCAGGFSSTLTDTATKTTATSSSTSSATTTGTNTASATSTNSASQAGSSSSNSVSSGQKSWFSTHWQWVLMLIILAIGFSALAAGAIWLKKRLDAKQPNLYHGDDREEGNTSGGSGGSGGGVAGPAAAFFAGSLRNLSRSNVNSARASTTNSGSTNDIVPSSKAPRVQQQPNMSTTSFSNRRSSILRNSVSSSQMNNANQNNHQMWGPNQAREIDNIAPVEEPVFRNSMASAAAAAAYGGASAGEGIGVATSTANNSRTDLSSAAAGGGRATPRNMNRLSGQSASSSNLHQKQQMQQSHRVLQRPKSANSASPVSAVSPIS